MIGRLRPSLTLVLVLACTPKSEESASDTAVTTDQINTSGPTTTDPTTGATDDPTGTGDTSTEDCPAPDPVVNGSISVNFGDWPDIAESSEYPVFRVSGDCTVVQPGDAPGDFSINLSCSDITLEIENASLTFFITGPADFGVDLAPGDAVSLYAYSEGSTDDHPGGTWFVMRDAGGDLVLAGLDFPEADEPSSMLAPLTVERIFASGCDATCEDGCTDPELDAIKRVAVGFTHDGGPSVEVLDGHRAELVSGDERYDIVVPRAEVPACEDCPEDYLWLLRRVE